MMSQNKIIFSVFLICVIVGAGLYAYDKRDEIFHSKSLITYSDGCVEEYKGTELITVECTAGRAALEAQNNQPGAPLWNLSRT